MCNLATRALACFLLTAAVLPACTLESKRQDSLAGCVEQTLSVQVVRTDERNKRLFLVDGELDAEILQGQMQPLGSCFERAGWGKDWALSVYADSKYAGYKDEAHIIAYHENDAWAKAYLMEYGNGTHSLTRMPALGGAPSQLSVK